MDSTIPTTTSQLPCLQAASAVLAAAAKAWRGLGAAQGPFWLPREGSVCSDCPLTSRGTETARFPRRCWVARLPGLGAKPSCSTGERGLSGFIRSWQEGRREKVFLLLLGLSFFFPNPRIKARALVCGTT